ncbi:MAG: PASTA domain-containing protein, partial [Chitinophagaceae bacterium]|nr:PASTA domain-containing protein [Chitinophagaceae bacterium]
GDGVGNKDFVVPDITGMNFCDARDRLEEHGIIIGAVVSDPNVEDTCAAYIYKQNPERFDDEKRFNRIRSGQTMDVWLQNDKPAKDSTGKKEKGDKPKPKPRKPEEEGDKDNGYNK